MAVQARLRVGREFTWKRVFAAQLRRYARLAGKQSALDPDALERA